MVKHWNDHYYYYYDFILFSFSPFPFVCTMWWKQALQRCAQLECNEVWKNERTPTFSVLYSLISFRPTTELNCFFGSFIVLVRQYLNGWCTSFLQQQMYLVGPRLFSSSQILRFVAAHCLTMLLVARAQTEYGSINDDVGRWWFRPAHYSYNECICFPISLNAYEMLMCLRMPHAEQSKLNGENVTSFLFNSRCGRGSVHFPHAVSFSISFATALFAIIQIKTIKIKSIFYSVLVFFFELFFIQRATAAVASNTLATTPTPFRMEIVTNNDNDFIQHVTRILRIFKWPLTTRSTHPSGICVWQPSLSIETDKRTGFFFRVTLEYWTRCPNKVTFCPPLSFNLTRASSFNITFWRRRRPNHLVYFMHNLSLQFFSEFRSEFRRLLRKQRGILCHAHDYVIIFVSFPDWIN